MQKGGGISDGGSGQSEMERGGSDSFILGRKRDESSRDTDRDMNRSGEEVAPIIGGRREGIDADSELPEDESSAPVIRPPEVNTTAGLLALHNTVIVGAPDSSSTQRSGDAAEQYDRSIDRSDGIDQRSRSSDAGGEGLRSGSNQDLSGRMGDMKLNDQAPPSSASWPDLRGADSGRQIQDTNIFDALRDADDADAATLPEQDSDTSASSAQQQGDSSPSKDMSRGGDTGVASGMRSSDLSSGEGSSRTGLTGERDSAVDIGRGQEHMSSLESSPLALGSDLQKRDEGMSSDIPLDNKKWDMFKGQGTKQPLSTEQAGGSSTMAQQFASQPGADAAVIDSDPKQIHDAAVRNTDPEITIPF